MKYYFITYAIRRLGDPENSIRSQLIKGEDPFSWLTRVRSENKEDRLALINFWEIDKGTFDKMYNLYY